MVTYYNGMAQPFHLFHTGVPGYEKLQEGLAVLSEYIMDGLTNRRLRTLASRVVAVNHMVTGRSEEHTSELQSLMRISYAVFCLKKKTSHQQTQNCCTIPIIYRNQKTDKANKRTI